MTETGWGTMGAGRARPRVGGGVRRSLAAVAVASAIGTVVAAPGAGADLATLRIGFSGPLSGPAAVIAASGRDAAMLGLETLAVPGIMLELVPLDGAIDGIANPQQGARDITSFVADPSVIAVIGPYNSSTAQAQIPISSEAGLLQCGIATTNPGLTIGADAAALHSPLAPGITYVRVVGTDDVQSAAIAHYAHDRLGLERIAVIDDTDTFGKGVADRFEDAWTGLGGTIVGRQGAPGTTSDYLPILSAFAGAAPDALLFGGTTATGAGIVRRQMVQAGLGDLPFLAGEGLVDGSGDDAGSFISIAGDAAANSWSASASVADYPGRAAFETAYRDRFGGSPAAYANDAYACAQLIVAAIERVAATGPVTREAIRAAVTDPAVSVETVLGPIAFDANGDPSVKTSSLYRTDLTVDPDPAVPGTGAWIPVERIDVPVGSPVP